MTSPISISPAASAVPAYLHLMVFVILILATALFLGGLGAVLGYRNRLLAVSPAPSRTHVSLRADLEKGNTTQSGTTCKDDIKLGTGLTQGFLRWRRRVLYESDSVPELALLPSYKPKETAKRKILNFLLRKKRIIPDPPTIVTITRVIEAAEARERAAAAATVPVAPGVVVVAKADVPAPPIQPPASPPPSFQIPAIVVQCWDTPADHPISNPILPPSCSTASSYSCSSFSSSTASSTSGCRTPPESLSSLALSPAVASPAAFFFPGFAPSASMSSFDYLHVPPPSWGGPVHGHIAEPVLADVSNVSGARFVLGPAPPPRALLRSKAKGAGLGLGAAAYSPPPLACVALATSAPLKTVEGERRVRRVTARSARSAAGGMPRTPQEGVVGIVSAGGGVPLDPPRNVPASGGLEAVAGRSRSVNVPGSAGGSDDPRDSKRVPAVNEELELGTDGTPSPEKHARTSRADPEVSAILEQILSSSSTTSSLVDLILEAIAAETDESFHYTTVSSSFSSSPSTSSAASSSSSSSRASTASTASSRSGASWASDEDEEGDVGAKTGGQDAHRSFLVLEDESEEDFLDSVLSAYVRNDDDNYSLNLSSGSDYGEFDDIDLGSDPDRDPASGKPPSANVKGLLPPHTKFLSPVRLVHPGFAI
ncbi:hypothetical protein GSI_11449 [Ganoderma sinense ZZ0214-1]|uniref:Uncharacterized protein n=1 Tax=Ganoderma sinense ZZ0214-1 TaxID=1077348 RepID=A0A2G8RW12_9APHY|nr:hypothetical protein GSI_11449 [Ganoderma sinense ZZ0214-1]